MAPHRLGRSRDAPVEAVFRSAARLNGPGSEKDTRHVVLDISGCGIDYAPGDSFGLFPSNDPALADAVLAAMRAPPDFPVGGKSFRQALIEDYALSPAPDMLFELIGVLVGGERRRKAKLLAKGGDPDGDAASFDVLAALETFGPIHPDPEAFLECLEPLQPRLYSIASSPLVTPGEMHLTVDAVRYSVGARTRLGAASTFLADRLAPGARVKIYVQAAHGFGLPADPATPIVMVGPGTGHGAVPLLPLAPARDEGIRQGVAVLRPSAAGVRLLLSRGARGLRCRRHAHPTVDRLVARW